MPCVLKKVSITNFKSLRNVQISLRKFNVLVGPNGSGKTNFIEFFKFLKKSLSEPTRPYVPYLDWWDYRNIVWERKEELPITAKLCWVIDGLDVEYEISFSGIGGAFKILIEKLAIEKTLYLEREGPILRIKYDKDFLVQKEEEIRRELRNMAEVLRVVSHESRDAIGRISEKITVRSLSEQVTSVRTDLPNLLRLSTFSVPDFIRRREGKKKTLETEIIGQIEKIAQMEDFAIIILPQRTDKRLRLTSILLQLHEAISGFTILRHPNMTEVKSASLPRREDFLFEDSSNLNNVLYKWFSEKGKLPERIESVISELFPNVRIGFESTFDGRIYIKIFEKGVELHPPSIPDGLYKVLSVLAAIELSPSLLAIDEVENSLHRESLEYVLDGLKECESTVIVTTHSPLVVDIVRLEDLLIVERTEGGTVLSRVKGPEKLRRRLAKLKITQSESWLYGELKK
jgi:predicted ATPase